VLQLTSPAARGLLRAIVEDPADDVPRLLLADVLEEAGDEARAEFIRVQCRIATLDADMMSTEDCGHPDCPGCKERRALRRRERELFKQQGDLRSWIPEPVWQIIEAQGYVGYRTWFRRGFVAEIGCTVADWCGAECPCYWTEQNSDGTCSRCQGTGRTGRHGPALVLAAPIERVDIVSVHNGRGEDMSAINNLLRGIREQVGPDSESDALLAWARQEAGLPPLRP
jgi:uncharacterized protein (TIGR02996 family)